MLAGTYGKSQARLLLKVQWLVLLILCGSTLVGGYMFLDRIWGGGDKAVRWAIQALLVLAYLLWVLWANLEANVRPGEEQLLPALGAGNWMTLARGVLIAALAGFLFSPRPPGAAAWLPGAIYFLAVAADFLDGYLARLTRHVTCLGERLDMGLDGLGVLVAAGLAVGYGQAPAWFILVGLARYLFLLGLWLRQRLGKPVYDLSPSVSRRTMAGLQMGFMAVMLWPLFSPPGIRLAAACFALPFLAGFTRDWLTASGMLRGQPGAAAQRIPWLTLALRFAAVLLGVGQLVLSVQQFSSLAQQLDATGAPWSEWAVWLWIGLQAAVTGMIAAGALGRVSAGAGLVLLGLAQLIQPLGVQQVLLIPIYIGVLFTGTGPCSLWTPEEYFIHHRAGERHLISGEGG